MVIAIGYSKWETYEKAFLDCALQANGKDMKKHFLDMHCKQMEKHFWVIHCKQMEKT